jgi:hypothetical protein
VLLVAKTTQSYVRITQAARTRVLHDGNQVSVDRTLAVEPGWAAHDLVVEVTQKSRSLSTSWAPAGAAACVTWP